MKTLAKYLKPYQFFILFSVFLIFLQCITQLLLPDLMAKMVDVGIVEGDVNYILRMGVYMLVLTIASTICSITAGYYISKTASGFARFLRNDLFQKAAQFSLEEFDRFGTSTLVMRTANDVTQIQNVIMMLLRVVVVSPLMFLGSIILMYQKDVYLTGVVLLTIPFLFVFIFFVSRKMMPLMKLMQEKLDALSRVLRNRLTGVRVIRAFNKENAANKQYEESNADLTNVSLTVNRIMAAVFPGMSFLMNLAVVAVLWFGSRRIAIDTFSVGDLMAFIQYVFLIMFSVVMLSLVFIIIPRAKVSSDRILEVLNTDDSLHDPLYDRSASENEQKNSAAEFDIYPAVEFKNVSFRYSDFENDILKNLSIQVPRGETVAVIGVTGSGKTSLVNLIPRFYDVSVGSVFVNGKDVRSYSQADLRHKIGFVPQTAVLFSGTVAENIRYGKENASDDEIWQALEIAQAADFVKQMELGLNAPISQDGTNVSGGQKQRLTIARAIVGKPQIYIFDDNFSALDYKTDALLRKALKENLGGATIIIVAQRISTIKDVSQIIVLDKGEIVGIGTNTELMQKSAVYRQIVASQTAEEGSHESK